MADYYPLLVRAISGLPQNTAEARKVVYDRARAALLKQLRSVDPPLPEGEIGRERLSLEEAIRRIEKEYVGDAPEAAPPAPPPSPAPRPPRPEAAPHAPLNPRRPASPDQPPEPVRAGASKPAFVRPAPGSVPEDETTVMRDAEPTGGAEPSGDAPADERRPRVGRATVRNRNGADAAPETGGKGKRIAIFAGISLVLLGGIGVAIWKHSAIAALFGERPQQQAAPSAPPTAPDQPKSTDRVTQAGGAARPAQPAQAPRAPGQATTTRALLFEESPGNAQQIQQFEGTVTWKTETVSGGPGQPPDIGIRAEIQIPERKINVSFTLRRNLDQTLPASHTIEINFALPPDFPYGGVANVPVVRVKQTESAQGAPLAGLSVKVSSTSFLVGLSAAQVDKERNLQLLQTRPWIDIPIVYTNNKRAIIAFDKGAAGTQAFQDAFSAWGELYKGDGG
ncbi:hypothetical protein [Azorhizobium caulinodans]|uniref:hypothetical protein n=1 Tax=Azorhizobium caulinodans TaxID=7 RepID=UPI002FBE6671